MSELNFILSCILIPFFATYGFVGVLYLKRSIKEESDYSSNKFSILFNYINEQSKEIKFMEFEIIKIKSIMVANGIVL